MSRDAAEVLFGQSMPSAEPPAREPTELELYAERFYGPPKGERPDTRDKSELSVEEVLYGNTDPRVAFADAARLIENRSMEDHFTDPEQARLIADEWAGTFQKYRLNSTESSDVAEIGVAIMRTPPNAETVAAWERDARARLLADYGREGVHRALADAQALVAKDDRLRTWLHDTGAGSHPRVVALVAAKARALRLAGKL